MNYNSKCRLALLLALLLAGLQSAMAQFTASGRVTDSAGEGLPGASVAVVGASRGASTDVDGNFKVQVPGNAARLSITYTGFRTVTVEVSSSSPVANVTLEEDISGLDEVVVTGLASTIKRANASNAVVRLTGDELNGSTRPVTLDGAMHGKVVGANIQMNSGAPGGGISVKLRGISSIVGSSEPLYVIDGIIVNNSQFGTGAGTRAFNGAVTTANSGSQDQAVNRIADINPADIESIDVLKGPAAAAIYGTRANAGVIVITTKRGKSGKTNVRVSQDVGFSTAINLLESESWTLDKINLFGGFYGVDKTTATEIFNASGGKTVDYDKEMFGETGTVYNTNVSVSGGTDKTRFYVSGGYNDETGIVKNTGFTRYSTRLNLDHRLNDWIDVKFSAGYYNTSSSRSFLGNDNNGVSLGYTIAYLPNFLDLRPIERDGRLIYPVNPGIGQNPFEVRDRMENKDLTNRYLNSGELNLSLLRRENSSLKFSVRGGVDFTHSQPRIYAPEDMQYQSIRANPGASRFGNNKAFYTYIQNFLTYNWKIGGVDLTSQVGVLKNIQKTDESFIQGEGLLPGQRNPSTAQVVIVSQYLSEAQDIATDVSQDFNWGDKVIGRVGVRFDRSSLNGDVGKTYAFPRASVALNLTKFSFLADNKIFSQLKPRFAFGRTGGVALYGDRFSTLVSANYNGQLGAVAPSTNGNSGIEPETAQEIEVGLDFGLFNNRISVEATYYDKRVLDFLFPYTLSPSTGVTSVARYPVGDLSNKGIELGLNIAVVKNSKIEWNTGINFWTNKTNVDRLDVPPAFVPTSGFGNFGRNRLIAGYSPTLWWGRDATGASPVEFGKDAQPKFQLSWVNSLHFAKRFDFSMLWHTSQGNYLSSLTRELKDEGGTTFDWSQINPQENVVNGLSSRLFGNPGYTTENYLMDASYIRLREVSLYYSIPGVSKGTKGAVSNIKVGVSALNYITIWKNADIAYDPEASNFGNRSVGFGVDLTPFPSSKKLFFHVVADF
jgi:TonB-linked SusC/RagA family outer membrane protein